MAVYMYAGSFSPVREGGYDIYRWDPEKGPAEPVESVFPELAAGESCFDQNRNIIYFTNERSFNPGFRLGGGGEVFAVKVDPETGKLRELNRAYSYGSRPSYCAVSADGRYLIAVNFGAVKRAEPVNRLRKDADGKWTISVEFDDASTVLYSLKEDGSINALEDLILYENREEADRWVLPHAHSVMASPDGKFFAVCDLGTDCIHMYRIENGKLEGAGGHAFTVPQGFGPRYSCFHPEKPYLFVNFEDRPYVSSYSFGKDGSLSEISRVSVLPEDHAAVPTDEQSGLTISPDGKHLYTCIRGINQVAVFDIDPETGTLSRTQNYRLAGDRPKDCVFSPDGKYLAVACRGNDSAEFLAVNADGTLRDSGIRLSKKACGHIFFLEF